MTYVDYACRGALAAVFCLAVVGKVRTRASFAAFAASLDDLSLLPSSLRRAAPGGLVAAEAVTAVLLMVPVTGIVGFGCAASLLLLFAAAVEGSLRRGDRVRCLCFGTTGNAPMGRSHVVRNLTLAAVAVLGLAAALTGGSTAAPAGAAAAVAGGVVVGTLLTRWDDLRYLFSLTPESR